MSNPRAQRPIKAWYWWAIGVVVGIAVVFMVVIAIVEPTQEVLTGLAGLVIPVVLIGIEAVRQRGRPRRR
jgi:uncharacterized membrane protein YhaH (DUF805 family)